MPLPFLPVPPFPNVPIAPGVPPVARAVGAIAATAVALVADALGILGFQVAQWGVFDQSGNPVIIPDSIVAVEFRKEYRLSDFPVEQGGFGTYNKVAIPFDPRVTMTAGGSDAARTAFLAAIDIACSSMDLYNIVTPEVVYPSVSLTHYDYRRVQRSGVTLLTVDLGFEEVRVTGTAQFTSSTNNGGTSGATLVNNAKSSSGTPPVNDGTVQTDAITSSQVSATSSFT